MQNHPNWLNKVWELFQQLQTERGWNLVPAIPMRVATCSALPESWGPTALEKTQPWIDREPEKATR